jgi:hypothetical protein
MGAEVMERLGSEEEGLTSPARDFFFSLTCFQLHPSTWRSCVLYNGSANTFGGVVLSV